MLHPNRVARTRDTYGFQNTTISQLFGGTFARHEQRFRGIIRLDTTDVVRIGLLNALNQRRQLLLELLADSLWFRLLASFRFGGGPS